MMAGSRDLIVNPTFIWGSDHGWQPLCCSMSISDRLPQCGRPPSGHQFFCIAHDRTQLWQGIAQDVTTRLKVGVEYKVEACVSISGAHVELADVRATLKLESAGGKVTYTTLASGPVSKREWAFLKGKMELSSSPAKALVYLEGPPVGVDILASCFSIAPSRPETDFAGEELAKEVDVEGNVLLNPTFSAGVQSWSGICCRVIHSGSHGWKGASGPRGKPFALALDRTEAWQGMEQDITGLVQPHETYLVVAMVRTAGKPHEGAHVLATVRLEYGSRTRYLSVGRVKASSTEWVKLDGKLHLDGRAQKAFFYLEGPPHGVDLLVSTVVIKPAHPRDECVGSPLKKQRTESPVRLLESILFNATFSHGLQNWKLRSCRGFVCTCQENPDQVVPFEGKAFAVATQRTHTWSGIEQIITGRVEIGTIYTVLATVRIVGACCRATVLATLHLQEADGSERYITMGSLEATATEWKHLEGRLVVMKAPAKVSVFLEGPPPGTDILVDSFFILPASKPEAVRPPIIVDPKYGINIVQNHALEQHLTHWFPQGAARLSVATEDASLPSCPSSSNYIVASNRTQWWEGPAQTITDKLELFVVYQVSAWVRVGRAKQKVNVGVRLDGKWVTTGEVEADHDSWTEIMGSFRVERKKRPNYAMVCVQGPEPGVDLMVARLQIFAVDRSARFPALKAQADKIRKRDVVLKLNKRSKVVLPPGVSVRIEQTSRSFPLGCCLSRWCLDNAAYQHFFLQNFNWAVFENELKWHWTEPQRDTFNYQDADEMVSFCSLNQIPMRGHCIFWEDESNCQDWLKSLPATALKDALHSRAADLLTRYKGKFLHYDVNNEILHGRFYRERLNAEILPYMFKLARQFDPEALLFVNDFHVEDGVDGDSSPEKYAQLVEWLVEEGAPVGGVGVQGHAEAPVGGIVRRCLEKLSALGLPIWMTEVDVAAENEHLRADDLEVMLRESFAHPSVEGIILWGFWEGAMSRDHAHLVESDKRVNAAGKRLMSLREEWTTKAHGRTDERGHFPFRGYHGRYKVFVDGGEIREEAVALDFEVPKGDSPLVIELSLT